MTGFRQRLLTAVAGQLCRPHGLAGRGVAIMLNRGNRRSVAAAVEESQAAVGDTAADFGFGGGIGISLLLARVGARPQPLNAARVRSVRRSLRSDSRP